MAARSWTDAALEKLTTKEPLILADPDPTASGLRLSVYPSGRKTWSYRFRSPIDGKLGQVDLGQFGRGAGQLAILEARKKLAVLKSQRDEGRDPRTVMQAVRDATVAQEKAKRAEEAETGYTVAKLMRAFLEASEKGTHGRDKLRDKTLVEYQRLAETYIIPSIGTLPAAKVTWDDVKKAMAYRPETARKSSAKYVANRIFGLIGTAYRWAAESNDDIKDPTAGKKKPHKEKPREKKLLLKHLQKLAGLLQKIEDAEVRDVSLALVLSGARIDNVVAMRVEHLDLEERRWRIPSEAYKAGRSQSVPISGALKDLLERRIDKRKKGLVFERAKDTPIPSDTVRHHLADLSEQVGEHVHPHAIRAAVNGVLRSYCMALREEAEAFLGHAPSGVNERHYGDSIDYLPRLLPLAERLAGLILGDQGAKVVRIEDRRVSA